MNRLNHRLAIKSQQGVALIQVIITTSIIMLLMIYFLTAAKSQVDRARALQNKTQAYLSHYSTNSALLYRMLTTDLTELTREGWNFHGVPFRSNDDAMVSVQDLNGLLSLASINKPDILAQLLNQSLPSGQSREIAASLVDWIDADDLVTQGGAEQPSYADTSIKVRNGPIQTYTELPLILGMNYTAEQLLLQNTTIHPTPYFNPMVAPKGILSAYLRSPSTADAVNKVRNQSGFNVTEIEQLTGLTSEDGLDYIYGPAFRVIINSKVGDSYFGKVLEYSIKPYDKRPVRVLSRLPGQPLEQQPSSVGAFK